MKKLIFIVVFIFTVQNINAQKLDYGNDLSAIKICNAIQGNNFLSESEADNALDKILNVIGASKRFVLQPCDNINNAVALSFKGVRYIMYDPEFMQMLSYSNNWSNMFVLAHEVGHHINGHSIDAVLSMNDVVSNVPLSKKRIQELEADEFAGFVLGRLGAKLSDATSAVSKMSDGDDSYSTHPRKSKRIAAIKKGFNESGGVVDSNKSVEKGKTVDSKYSNAKYVGLVYTTLTDYYSDAVYTGYVNKLGKPYGYGSIFVEDGSVYKGEVKNGNKNGYGKMTYSNGQYYEGFWVNNSETGEGVFATRTFTMTGGFSKNLTVHGTNKTNWQSGASLDGIYENGELIKAIYSDPKLDKDVELGFLDNSYGNGQAVFTDLYGRKFEGSFDKGEVVGKRIIKNIGKEAKKKFRKIGFDLFIPKIILDGLDITILRGYDGMRKNNKIGFLKQINKDGSIHKGYFNVKGSWMGFERAGYGEKTYPKDYDYSEWNEKPFDKFIGMYWDDVPNGYGMKLFNGKIVEKGIYQNGNFVKSENFDEKLMQETFKNFY